MKAKDFKKCFATRKNKHLRCMKQSSLLGFFKPKPDVSTNITQRTENPLPSTPIKTPKKSLVQSTPKSAVSRQTTSFLSSEMFSSPQKRKGTQDGSKKLKQEEWLWLKHPKDDQKRTKSDPNYDPTTLYIPPSDFEKLTGMEKQYWEIKKTMFDTIIFFQKGKFYELYSIDADIANSHFGMTLANRSSMMRMCGVPTYSFDDWAHKFASQGFRIARVDQAEDEGKLKRRFVSQVYTKSTLFELETDPFGSFCLCLFQIDEKIGLSMVDVSSSQIFITAINFNDYNQILGTLLARRDVKEVLLPRGNLNSKIVKFIKGSDPAIDIQTRDIDEFVSLQEFTDYIVQMGCLNTTLGQFANYCHKVINKKENSNLPASLDLELNEEQCNLILPSLSGILYYLCDCRLFEKLKDSFKIQHFDPLYHSNQFQLDGTTINHLEIFGSDKFENEASLFAFLDSTKTNMGKRLLKTWLLHPLTNMYDILDRQKASHDVEFDFCEDAQNLTNFAYDIPRVLAKLSAGLEQPKKFVAFLKSISLLNVSKLSPNVKSSCLKSYFEILEDLELVCSQLEDIFDFDIAVEKNITLPRPGFDADLDNIEAQISQTESEMQNLVKNLQKSHQCSSIQLIDSNNDYFLIQVPNHVKMSSAYSEFSKTAKVTRYQTKETKTTALKYKELLLLKDTCLENVKISIYNRFLQHKKAILGWSEFIATLDVLISFVNAKNKMGCHCLPEFESGKPSLFIENSSHPVMNLQNEFIPNDIELADKHMLILTGPNMGGKSTLLRQVCVAVILAQIGMVVPASKYVGTIVDNIFTRVGARDDLMTGQSTFMVELRETSRILKLATPNSLVILDEFGRGTSSADGYALACSVLSHFLSNVKSRLLFATHFKFALSFESIQYRYMNYNLNKQLEHLPSIVFLYKLVDGICPSSCGFEVAKLAGISSKIIERAQIAANSYAKAANKNADFDKQIQLLIESRLNEE
eukprot:NODE_378_length_8478_cov_0.790070.p1 type:complete len:976 gc:universal NODE_378_length_8478_cov_0.790070:3828-6755(+)